MRIAQLYAQREKPLISFEFFTPKNDAGKRSLFRALERLSEAKPAFVSITCGAAGTTRERTADLAVEVQKQFGLTVMAHVVCTGTTQQELTDTLQYLQRAGIENILALRGDPPRGQTDWKPTPGGFRYANELASFVKERFELGIGGACYPEKHHEAPSLQDDLQNLRRKVDAGAEFLITQLFFDNQVYWSFVDKAASVGIEVPIVPGIMPVLSAENLRRIASLSPGTAVPVELEQALDAAKDESTSREAGVAFATTQCHALLERGAPGIHFYTLNKSRATLDVLDRLHLSS